MKRILFVLMLVVGMMTCVYAQRTASVSFIDETGQEVYYDLGVLQNIIHSGDTLVDDVDWLLRDYESVFPLERGSNEPAFLILKAVDYYDVVFIQETKYGKLITLRIFTNDGWIQLDKKGLKAIKALVDF